MRFAPTDLREMPTQYLVKFRCAGITLRKMVSAVKNLTLEKIGGEKSHHGQRSVLSAVAKINRGTAHISAVKSHHYCDVSYTI